MKGTALVVVALVVLTLLSLTWAQSVEETSLDTSLGKCRGRILHGACMHHKVVRHYFQSSQ